MSQHRARSAVTLFRSPGRAAPPLWRNSLLSLFSIGLLALTLAACGGTGGSNSGGVKTGGTLNVGLDSDAVTLDPLKSTALVDRQVMLNMYDTLVRVDTQNKIQPDLATLWSYPSPTQLVFTLRSDEPDKPLAPAQTEARVKAVVDAASAKVSRAPNRVVVFPNLQSFSIDANALLIQNLLDAEHIETATLNKA